MVFTKDTFLPSASIKVLGVGGGGTNAVSTMIRESLDGVDFVAANTDVQSLKYALAPQCIQLGKELTKGLGAGADPDIGRDSALEDRHELQEALQGADMVFVTAGMGGGTGTGGAPIVAQIARDLGALTVGVVTKPFTFEGKRRMNHAEMGIERLREHVDTLLVIPNQRLLQIAKPQLTMVEAFRMADEVLVNAVKGISDIINVPGMINVDFADVKAIMTATGQALMGIGYGEGENRAVEAARQAISSPLLEDVDIEGATGILINITAPSSISLLEINDACTVIQEAAHEQANIIFGTVIDESMENKVRITVIATGFSPIQVASLPRRTLVSRPHKYESYHQSSSASSFSHLSSPSTASTSSSRPVTAPSPTPPLPPPPSSSSNLAQEGTEPKPTSEESFLAQWTLKNPVEEHELPDVDKSLDEALKLAVDVTKSFDDALEIPAFLRHSLKDLPAPQEPSPPIFPPSSPPSP